MIIDSEDLVYCELRKLCIFDLSTFSFSIRYQTQYLSRSIEYCDVDDIKAEYAAEIKQVIALANTGTPAGSAANSVHGFAGAEDKADGQEAEGKEGKCVFFLFGSALSLIRGHSTSP